MACTDEYNLDLVCGQTEARTFLIKDPDGTPWTLTGYNFESQIRDSPNSDLILDLGPYLAQGTGIGEIDLNIPYTVTSGLAGQNANWDMFLVISGQSTLRILSGPATITESITSIT